MAMTREITEEELEQIIEKSRDRDADREADLTADADEVENAPVQEDIPAKTQTDIEKETLEDDEKGQYYVNFFRPYRYKDEEITGIDLSGMQDLTARDAQRFDRILARLNHEPPNKFTDSIYCKHVAVKATGMPLDFFDDLQIRDMMLIIAKVNAYFLFG